MTLAGSVVELPTAPATTDLWGIARGADGNQWFTEQGNVGRMTLSGSSVAEFHVISPVVRSITSARDGNLWFAEAGAVGTVDVSGVVTEFDIPTPSGAPEDIVEGPNGIYFTESAGHNIGFIPSDSIFADGFE
jgi:virginiamycin B lyase